MRQIQRYPSADLTLTFDFRRHFPPVLFSLIYFRFSHGKNNMKERPIFFAFNEKNDKWHSTSSFAFVRNGDPFLPFLLLVPSLSLLSLPVI